MPTKNKNVKDRYYNFSYNNISASLKPIKIQKTHFQFKLYGPAYGEMAENAVL